MPLAYRNSPFERPSMAPTSAFAPRDHEICLRTPEVRSGFENYATFDGRASRPAYWWWFLFVILVTIAANILDAIVGIPIFSIVVALGLLLPNLSVGIRRLHDTGHTGWWILIGLIPIIGFIVLLIFFLQDGDPGENEYGPPMAEGVA